MNIGPYQFDTITHTDDTVEIQAVGGSGIVHIVAREFWEREG
jgi:hypothetical protein